MVHPTKVYHITPARADKNFGKACNDQCRDVPEDAWICLRDADTMFLTPNYSQHIEDIVEKYKDIYDVIGCLTNRIGLAHQLINKTMSEDTDVRNHMNIALQLEKTNYAEVVRSPSYVAGHFLLFSKKSWVQHPFEEGKILITKIVNKKRETGFVDYWFSNYFFKRKRVGIATGLYIFHLYRLFHPNRSVKTHLL